jgi:hypothetical protein
LFSKAKEGLDNSLAVWFRRKYNLSPKDPRYLEMTSEELMEDWLLEQLEINPKVTYEELLFKTSTDDEWMEKMERESNLKALKTIFDEKKATPPEEKVELLGEKEFEVIESETKK